MATKVNWEAGTWHLLTVGFTPTNSAIFVDDQLLAIGDGLPAVASEFAPYTSLAIGSAVSGETPAQGQIEEFSIFSGRKKMQQIMGNIFGLSVDWEIGLYYASLSKTAALGPISDAEIAARKARAEKVKAERAALGLEDESGGGVEMLRLVGGTSVCFTNIPLQITNMTCAFNTNQGYVITFDIQGSYDGTSTPLYDIFTTTNLNPSSVWTWLERGTTCSTYQYTNQPSAESYYILGTPLDTDSDGITDAFEKLFYKTDSFNADTDGDGMSDGWEIAHGLNPLINNQPYTPPATTLIITKPISNTQIN